MKLLVVYYSFEGSTEYAAKRIAEYMGADLLKLRPENEPPRNPLLKFVFGGKSVILGEKARLNRFKEEPAEYDGILLGSPVWAGKVTPAVREFVLSHPFENKKVGLFACSASGEAGAMFANLKTLLGGNEVISELSLRNPEKHPAEAEEQIAEFCRAFIRVQVP